MVPAARVHLGKLFWGVRGFRKVDAIWRDGLKVAVMQPYFFPYLGYFHLIDAVDVFVLLDDVQYPKGGWVNRNRILINGKVSWLTVPVTGDGGQINNKWYLTDEALLRKMQKSIARAYPKSAAKSYVSDLLAEFFSSGFPNVVSANLWLMKEISVALDLEMPEFLTMSDLKLPNWGNPEERIIEAVRILRGETYVNLSGGSTLYSAELFGSRGIALRFVESRFPPYPQKAEGFISHLSSADLLLSQEAPRTHWVSRSAYELVEKI